MRYYISVKTDWKTMQRHCLKKLVFFFVLLFLCACTQNRFPSLVVAEEGMVQDCHYLDTISDISDPGKMVLPYKYGKFYDGELKVLERANHMGATHVVWIYNYSIGSSASVYRCDK